jgi:hypothetical protein
VIECAPMRVIRRGKKHTTENLKKTP